MAGRWDKTERPAALYIKSKGVPGALNFGQGFSIIDGETDLGIISIGSAILDKDGSPNSSS